MLVTYKPRIRINFVSAGTRFLGSLAGFEDLSTENQYSATALVWEGQRANDPGENRVSKALRLYGIPVDLCISAMPCRDPAARTKHMGLSYEVQSRMFERHHDWFRKYFRRVNDAMCAAIARQESTLSVAVYCKSGRHRSVAAVEIATHVLQNS